MNFINELLPETRKVQMQNANRDKKHKQQMRYQQFKAKSDDDQQSQSFTMKDILWAEIERRSGEDRRQQQDERGKWLESRHLKDRRQGQNFHCKI